MTPTKKKGALGRLKPADRYTMRPLGGWHCRPNGSTQQSYEVRRYWGWGSSVVQKESKQGRVPCPVGGWGLQHHGGISLILSEQKARACEVRRELARTQDQRAESQSISTAVGREGAKKTRKLVVALSRDGAQVVS